MHSFVLAFYLEVMVGGPTEIPFIIELATSLHITSSQKQQLCQKSHGSSTTVNIWRKCTHPYGYYHSSLYCMLFIFCVKADHSIDKLHSLLCLENRYFLLVLMVQQTLYLSMMVGTWQSAKHNMNKRVHYCTVYPYRLVMVWTTFWKMIIIIIWIKGVMAPHPKAEPVQNHM